MTTSWTDEDTGLTHAQPQPELDWADVAILTAWEGLTEHLCSLCGRPLAVHEQQSPDHFHTAFRTCPAVTALDRDQAERRRLELDKAELDQGLDPERARTWLTWTDAEGEPPY